MAFDVNDGDVCFEISDDTMMDSKDHLMGKISDCQAIDYSTGVVHTVCGMSNSWDDDDDD